MTGTLLGLDETPIKVLDRGYVRYVDSMGTDETVVSAARMSTGKGFISWEPYARCDICGTWRPGAEPYTCVRDHKTAVYPRGDLGLLTTLYRDGHSTPFEMCELAIEVQAPIMVFREWHRHRTQAYSEFSARYAQMPNLHYVPELERFQKQSTVNKQGSSKEVIPEAEEVRSYIAEQQEQIYSDYDEWVNQYGLAKEVARVNTPVSRYSKMRAKTDLRNWFGFLNLRLRPNAQYEIRCYAEAVASIIKKLWPRCYALFEEYDLNGVRLSATEAAAVRGLLNLSRPLAADEVNAALMKKLGAS